MLEKIKEIDKKYYMNTFGERLPVVFKEGKGLKLISSDNKTYYDFLGGIAVNSLGHGNEALVNTICDQTKKVIHTSNYYYIEHQAELAKLLCDNSCADKVFFANSGAEANEAAIKLIRKYFYKQNKMNKTEIITLKNSFHGRTLTTISATGQEKYQKPFKPLTEKFIHIDINDINTLKNAINENTAGIMIELIQGESGVNPLSYEYVREIREICDKNDIVMLVDEVQTGVGRCGKLFCYENYQIEPDMFTLAKGLGGGVPIGALLCKDKFAAFEPGDHGSTFGGNPLACAAAICVLKELLNNGVLENANKSGYYFRYKLNELKDTTDKIEEIRGVGLMLAVKLKEKKANDMFNALFSEGILVGKVGDDVIRILPPLIISKTEVDLFIEKLTDLI